MNPTTIARSIWLAFGRANRIPLYAAWSRGYVRDRHSGGSVTVKVELLLAGLPLSTWGGAQ